MSTASQRQYASRLAKLASLERLARRKLRQEDWDKPEALNAIQNYAMMAWGISQSAARDMAKTVQLRLVNMEPRESVRRDPLPVDVEKEMSVEEIISSYRAGEEPPPKTDFQIHEENLDVESSQ